MIALALIIAANPLTEADKVTGFSVSVERVAVVTSIGATLTADPLVGELVLTGLKLKDPPPRLCPTVERRGERLVLRCTTRRIWARLANDSSGSFIDLRQTTGVSWLDLGLVPMRAWSLKSVALPDTCPGTLAAARAECANARGEPETARAAWVEGLTGPDASLCNLRLGDLAIREGAIEKALAHYAKIPSVGHVGRLGLVRTCELLGTCLSEHESERVGRTEGLAADLARDVRLSTVRRELSAGRDDRAMAVLLDALESDPEACEGELSLCQKLIGVGLQSPVLEARVAALSAFLTDKARVGPEQYALNQAASAVASELGAPGFAASILSVNTPQVPSAELLGHLLGIVKLYLAARDPVRATVVLEYAEGKLGDATRSGEWSVARRKLGRRAVTPVAERTVESLEGLSAQVSLSTDLARAAALRSRASHVENTP